MKIDLWCGLALGACALVTPSCNPLHSCGEAGCSGSLYELALVDDAGNPAAARGEYRYRDADRHVAAIFDCSSGAARDTAARSTPTSDAGATASCPNGLLSVGFEGRPDMQVDLRFELADGSWSGWQAVALEITRQTDPDFNGPDCPCSWYSATAAPTVVPAEARRSAP